MLVETVMKFVKYIWMIIILDTKIHVTVGKSGTDQKWEMEDYFIGELSEVLHSDYKSQSGNCMNVVFVQKSVKASLGVWSCKLSDHFQLGSRMGSEIDDS